MLVDGVYIQQFKVQSYQVDRTLNLSMTYMLDMLQEAAFNHVMECGMGWNHLRKENAFWALSKLYVKVNRMPAWNEMVTVSTWGKPAGFVIWPRDYEMHDVDGNVLVQATSDWVILDVPTSKPQRATRFTDRFALNGNKVAIETSAPKISPVEKESDGLTLPVLLSDIDMNQHVNNVKYVQWALDSFPREFVMNHKIVELAINFIAQAKWGDSYRFAHNFTTSNTIETAIRSAADDHDYCRLRTVWE